MCMDGARNVYWPVLRHQATAALVRRHPAVIARGVPPCMLMAAATLCRGACCDACLGCLQHLGSFTFFAAVLVAIERACTAAPAAAAGAAAAETLYQAVVQLRGELLQRLAALAHSPPHMSALEHFTLLAQVRAILPPASLSMWKRFQNLQKEYRDNVN